MAALFVVGVPGAAASTTYYVAPSGSDAITCATNSPANPFATIQAALACTADGDAVSLAPDGGTPYPGIGTVSHNVTIEAQAGANARSVEVDPTPAGMTVPDGVSVTVDGVALACTGDFCGSPVTNHGTLTLHAVAVTGTDVGAPIENLSSNGGGGANLTLLDSTISDNPGFSNAASGGIDSRFESGATSGTAPSATIANSTIADNGIGGDVAEGGGVNVSAGGATIVNSTIAGNVAQQRGGGIAARTNGPVALSNTLVADNTTAIFDNPDCFSMNAVNGVKDGPGGHNLIGDGTGCALLTDGTNGDQVGVPNPGLGSLADNGGPTDTVALQSSSPAIGAADVATCQGPPIGGADQRGAPRGSSCDIGGYERWSVTIDSSPTHYTRDPDATFAFSSSEPGAGFRCRLISVEGHYSDCTSPTQYTGLAEGTYRFRVFARANGVHSLTATRTWTIDRTPPSAQIDSGPSETSGPDVSFMFSGSDSASGIHAFRCHLDGAPWHNCASPQDYSGLADGPHRFYLRAVDRAGNRSHAVIWDWTVVTPS